MTQRNNQGGSGAPPFYMVQPDASGGTTFVKANADGTFDVTVQIGLIRSNDNNSYTLVRFINDKIVPGVISIRRGNNTATFSKVKPNNKGEAEVALSLVSKPDIDSALKLTVSKDDFDAVAPAAASPKKSSIKVAAGLPRPDGVTSVVVHLIDPTTGAPKGGEVEVRVGQQFKIGADEYPGYHKFTVDPVGFINLEITPLGWSERFSFQDVMTGDAFFAQVNRKR